MPWVKLGQIFSEKDLPQKNLSHSSNPTPVFITENIIRIFYSARDLMNRSSIYAFDFDILCMKIVKSYEQCFLKFGNSKTYYRSGISLGGFYEFKKEKFILFMGWENDQKNHWRGNLGRIRLCSNCKLLVADHNPLLKIDNIDPISFSYPCILPYKNKLYMWYGSTKTWDGPNNEMIHIINYAVSNDGTNWEKKGQALPFKPGSYQAFSRPSVIKDKQNNLLMMFSYRPGNEVKYNIGGAKSENGEDWNLELSNLSLKVSKDGWDSEMVEYPHLFEWRNDIYMLYNGNDFGKSGIGISILA